MGTEHNKRAEGLLSLIDLRSPPPPQPPLSSFSSLPHPPTSSMVTTWTVPKAPLRAKCFTISTWASVGGLALVKKTNALGEWASCVIFAR